MANRLTWIPSTAPDIAHYDVYRGPSSTGSWTFLTGVLDQPRTSASFSGTVFFYVDASGTTSSWYRLDASSADSTSSLRLPRRLNQSNNPPNAPRPGITSDISGKSKEA